MSEDSDRLKNLRIVLLGKTGSGKSSTGNTIIGGFEFEQGVSTKSITRQCQRHVTAVEEDKTISVIDTPGLYDTEMSEEELKKEMEKCIYMSAPGPHVFLLVIRVGVRFTEEEKKTVKWIQKHFGGKASHHTIILFTHTDHLKGLSLDEYISESNDLKALINECGGRFHSFNNEDMSNRSQVTELLQKIDELVRINGGQHYTNERFQEAQRRIEQEASKQKLEVNVQTALTAAGGGVVVVGAAVGAAALGVAVVLVGAGLGMIVSLFVGAAVGGAIALGAVVGVAAALGVALRRAGGEGGAVGVAVGWAVVVGLAVGAGVGGVVVGAGVVGVEVENKGIVSVGVAVSVVGGVVAAIAAAAATFAIAKRK